MSGAPEERRERSRLRSPETATAMANDSPRPSRPSLTVRWTGHGAGVASTVEPRGRRDFEATSMEGRHDEREHR
ncbi:MAG: hypothetical protein M3O70_07830, partial [Actinomycetota bacterium]|nr:hypothetical protein [Actinomycetota bacterium]